MHPTSSFLSKSLTVLIGMGLSWATTTNPHADQIAQYVFGSNQSVPSSLGGVHSEVDLNAPFDEPTSPMVQVKSKPEAQPPATTARAAAAAAADEGHRIEQISGMLRELGATYLRLEKLSKSDGTWYRVRCDLAGESHRVKCCLEATRESAVAAMEDVLQAARSGSVNPGTIAATG